MKTTQIPNNGTAMSRFQSSNGRPPMRVSYALRRVPTSSFDCLLPRPAAPQSGDIVLAELERIGRNTRLELAEGRACQLHRGDLLAVVFGNRYATEQFEGYARAHGDACDLLSMGGLCGLLESKHAAVEGPTKLRLLGAIGDPQGQPLRLKEFALPAVPKSSRPHIAVVCGSSMDAGKTYTAASLIHGLHRRGQSVAGIKLTGTAAGRDTWAMLDAGACAALNFIDGGYPSTYLCTPTELLKLYSLLVAHAAALGARWVVVEIADGLFQQETSALLRCRDFVATVDAWMFATNDPLAAACGVRTLRGWGIEPVAISGVLTQSPLAMQEAVAATGVACVTAGELQSGSLNDRLLARVPTSVREFGRKFELPKEAVLA
jgi:hypothetical protein